MILIRNFNPKGLLKPFEILLLTILILIYIGYLIIGIVNSDIMLSIYSASFGLGIYLILNITTDYSLNTERSETIGSNKPKFRLLTVTEMAKWGAFIVGAVLFMFGVINVTYYIWSRK